MIRIGIAGAGNMGRQHYLAFSLMNDVRVTAIADNREDNARSIAGGGSCRIYKDIEEMLGSGEVDAVDLCLPTPLHKEYTLTAALYGKHVFCEKPIALTDDDARTMIDACAKRQVLFAVGHCLRFSGEYLLLREAIVTKKYGELLSLRLFRHSAMPRWSQNNWLEDPAQSGGAVLDLHIHDVDMLLFLLGKPRALLARGSLTNLTTVYEYDNTGAAITVESSWQFPSHVPFRAGYEAVFEKASLTFDLQQTSVYENDKEALVIPAHLFISDPVFLKSGSLDSAVYLYYLELLYFTRCLQTLEEPTRISPQNARNALSVALLEMDQLKAGTFGPVYF